jgi:hypothetical protein
MIIILIILIINYLIAKLLIRLTQKLSAIYIENSQVLAQTIKSEQYEFYLKIYENPKCLDNILLLHIPIYNLFSCHIVYMAIINAKIKLNQ